jgi:catechol 2,3-dioxygenase-like lactoylglutathione lyase family enzyme
MVNRARLIGINHVALEVSDLQAALDLYGRLFDFELRGYMPSSGSIPRLVFSFHAM